MAPTNGKSSPIVRRITVDEKLSTGLIRVLVSELKPGVVEFDDDLSYWGPETGILVRPNDFQYAIGITSKASRDYPWNSLYEGQTFLQGYFVKKTSRASDPRFIANAKRKNFLCINNLIKKSIKQIYFSAIKGA